MNAFMGRLMWSGDLLDITVISTSEAANSVVIVLSRSTSLRGKDEGTGLNRQAVISMHAGENCPLTNWTSKVCTHEL